MLMAATSPETWLVIAEGCTAIVAIVTLLYNWYQGRKLRRTEAAKDYRSEANNESKVSGEYLKRSLDAFDELVTSLQAEVTRMTVERNEARRIAEDIEKRLNKELGSLKLEIKALRQVLTQHGIPIPVNMMD